MFGEPRGSIEHIGMIQAVMSPNYLMHELLAAACQRIALGPDARQPACLTLPLYLSHPRVLPTVFLLIPDLFFRVQVMGFGSNVFHFDIRAL